MGTTRSPHKVRCNFVFSVEIGNFGLLLVDKVWIKEKRYGFLFTCRNLNAVHLELKPSLSTESFLMAFIRFCERRSVSKKGVKTLNDKALEHNIKRKFNTPEYNQHSVLWELVIRSTRKVITVIFNDH